MQELKNHIWDEKPVDVTAEANFIWQIENKLRGLYISDKYGGGIVYQRDIQAISGLSNTREKN